MQVPDFASDICCRNRTALDGALQEWLQNGAAAFDALLAQLVRQHQQRSELSPVTLCNYLCDHFQYWHARFHTALWSWLF